MGTPSNPLSVLSPASMALSNSSALQEQLADETEEARRKRLQLQQQKMALGPAAQSLGLGV
jgi:hypothetical protein